MQIQRLTGPKSSFELMLSEPAVQISQNALAVQKWQKSGDELRCLVYLESMRDPELKNQRFGRWIGALPVEFLKFRFTEKEPDNSEEFIDAQVDVTTLHLIKDLVPEEDIIALYERYIERATERYGLISEPLTNE